MPMAGRADLAVLPLAWSVERWAPAVSSPGPSGRKLEGFGYLTSQM